MHIIDMYLYQFNSNPTKSGTSLVYIYIYIYIYKIRTYLDAVGPMKKIFMKFLPYPTSVHIYIYIYIHKYIHTGPPRGGLKGPYGQ